MRSSSPPKFFDTLVAVLLMLMLGAGIFFPMDALAHDNYRLPSQDDQPPPSTGMSCELVDGSWEACYPAMCEYEEHNNVWVLYSTFRYACNPYDGCVYYGLERCPNGCDASDPNNQRCIEDAPSEPTPDNTDDSCANVDCSGWPPAECEDNTSWSAPACNPDTGRCEFTYPESCGSAGCNPGTGFCYEESEADLCAGVFCEDPTCSPDGSQSWEGVSCNPDNGRCEIANYIDPCPLGCDFDTGLCIQSLPGADPCLGIICPPAKCDGDISQHGQARCNPDTGECEYILADSCDNGCDPATGLCLENPTDLCSGVTCEPVICSPDGTESWINGFCNSEDGDCYYTPISCEGAGCNPATGQCNPLSEDESDETDDGYYCDPAACSPDGRYSGINPKYNPETNECTYQGSVPCDASGCNSDTGRCYQVAAASNNDSDILSTLATIGGVSLLGGGVLGGGYLGLRALQRRNLINVREIISRQPKPSRFEAVEKGVESTGKRIDELLDRLNNMERATLQRGLDTTTNLMESYHRSAAATENIALLPSAVKFVADTGADIVGLAPGAGRYFKWAYHSGTTFIQEGIENGIGSAIYESAGKAVETVAGDWFGDVIKTPQIKSIQRFTTKAKVKDAIKQTGLKALGQNAAKDKGLGKLLKKVNDETSHFLFGK